SGAGDPGPRSLAGQPLEVLGGDRPAAVPQHLRAALLDFGQGFRIGPAGGGDGVGQTADVGDGTLKLAGGPGRLVPRGAAPGPVDGANEVVPPLRGDQSVNAVAEAHRAADAVERVMPATRPGTGQARDLVPAHPELLAAVRGFSDLDLFSVL